jgi:hypothetical protein
LSTQESHWNTFTHYYNKTKSTISNRIKCAVLNTVAQFGDTSQGLDIFVAPGTDMAEVLIGLYELAAKLASTDNNPNNNNAFAVFRERLYAATDTNALVDDDTAFRKFLSALHDRQRPAIYIGGLSQRLLAEACDADVLIDHNDLKSLLALNSKELKLNSKELKLDLDTLLINLTALFTPHNILVANSSFLRTGREQLELLQERWNSTVDLINDQDLSQINFWFDDCLEEYINSLELPDLVIERHLINRRKGMFERIVQSHMILFNKWMGKIITG